MVQQLIRSYSGGMKLPEVARISGIGYERLRNIKRGIIQNVTEDEVSAIAKALGAPDGPADLPRVVRTKLQPVPVVGSASMGSGSSDHPDNYELYVPASMASDDCRAWEAEGDSMAPWIAPGDVVLVRPHKVPRVGYPMLVRREDGSVSLKIIAFENGGYLLKSLNPAYPSEPADVEYIGYMTGRYRSVAGYELIESELSGLRPIF